MEVRPSPEPRDALGILARGWSNYRSALFPNTVASLAVLLTYGAARFGAIQLADGGDVVAAILLDIGGLIVATVVALPWFATALAVEGGGALHWGAALSDLGSKIRPMLVASVFFWAGVALGLRYLAGIPSVFVLIWYGFFGFVVASGAKSGLKALGASVRVAQGRRWVVAFLTLLLFLLNTAAALPVAYGVNAATAVVSIILLIITTNVSMGAGAHLFNWLVATEPVIEPKNVSR